MMPAVLTATDGFWTARTGFSTKNGGLRTVPAPAPSGLLCRRDLCDRAAGFGSGLGARDWKSSSYCPKRKNALRAASLTGGVLEDLERGWPFQRPMSIQNPKNCNSLPRALLHVDRLDSQAWCSRAEPCSPESWEGGPRWPVGHTSSPTLSSPRARLPSSFDTTQVNDWKKTKGRL